MSWEANAWACRQRMKLPQEQLVLLMLGNCADPDGVAFSKWPARDHWWKYLSEVTRLSRSSLFRHVNTIVALGLGARTMLVLADGSKRPTITLDLKASFDIDSEKDRYLEVTQGPLDDESHHETPAESDASTGENDNADNGLNDENGDTDGESHGETGEDRSPIGGTERVPLAGLHIESNLDSNLSPLPPSGGACALDDLFDRFVRAWGAPIERMDITRSTWDRTASDQRPTIVAAAKGYWTYRRTLSRPKEALSAKSFIRDAPGWTQWLRYVTEGDSGSPQPVIAGFASDSLEGAAIRALYAVARIHPFEGRRRIVYPGPITPQVMAFAKVADAVRAMWTEDRNQIGAWSSFLARHVYGNRPELVDTRGIGAAQRRGIWVPHPWPPLKDGTWPTAGPVETLMSEQEMADFK